MIRKTNIIILIFFCFFYYNLNAQKHYEIYEDDSVHIYFKTLGLENGFYYCPDNMNDFLADGVYLFYNVKKKDSLSDKKEVIYRGEYRNNLKHGRFEACRYFYNKKTKNQELRYRHICDYKNGKKEGIEEVCHVSYYAFNSYLVSTQYYGEFKDGKKHGLFIHSYNGIIFNVEVYENGELKEVLLKRENSELRELIEKK
jgi:hypothetical protein